MTYNLKETHFKDITHKSGIYLLKFPNGMYYLGSSGDIKERLNQHLSNFFTPFRVHSKWYIDAKTSLIDESRRTKSDFKRTCYTSIVFFIQYTNTLEEARNLESAALHEIKANNWCNHYYNSQF